jgi:hypothetical protein
VKKGDFETRRSNAIGRRQLAGLGIRLAGEHTHRGATSSPRSQKQRHCHRTLPSPSENPRSKVEDYPGTGTDARQGSLPRSPVGRADYLLRPRECLEVRSASYPRREMAYSARAVSGPSGLSREGNRVMSRGQVAAFVDVVHFCVAADLLPRELLAPDSAGLGPRHRRWDVREGSASGGRVSGRDSERPGPPNTFPSCLRKSRPQRRLPIRQSLHLQGQSNRRRFVGEDAVTHKQERTGALSSPAL